MASREREYDGVASQSHAGQVTPSDSQDTPTSSSSAGMPQHGLSSSLTINTGHQPKRLLSPAPIGLPAGSSQRTSPVPGYLSSLTSQHDAAGLQDEPAPSTPKRPALLSRGLSLQLPQSGDGSGSVVKSDVRTPLTPNLDQAISYATPASLLPRRSRGMDFSRAATHLHHSTLAEHPDPESSPIVGNRGVSVPRRNGNSAYDSPMRGGNSGSGMEQGAISSSVGSINMLDSGSDSSSDDDIAMRDEDETIHMTPQAGRNVPGMSGSNATMQSPGGEALFPFTLGANNFQNYREKLRSRGSDKRKNSSSNNKRSSNGWRYDLFGSPVYGSPPLVRSIESSENYFQRELSRRSIANRRESLSLGTDDMKTEDTPVPRIETDKDAMDAFGITPGANAEERRNVIKKAVTTRRSHLIPKTKGFARIRAALAEEGAPIDVENRREAEVIRQVKQREEHSPEDTLRPIPSQTNTSASSPNLMAALTGQDDSPPDDMSINNEAEPASTRRSSSSFSQQASRHGAGPDFWNRFRDDDRMRTPPPPLFPRESSSQSLMSEDASMTPETASTNTTTGPPLWPGRSNSHHGRTSSPSRARSNTPTTALQTEWSKKALGKRRREDDLDPEFFKRRAVSPGLSSITGSPILPPSPAQREGSWWNGGKASGDTGSKKETPAGHVAGERVGSGSSESGKATVGNRGLERRVGMQGMNEAGEGLMNMSID